MALFDSEKRNGN